MGTHHSGDVHPRPPGHLTSPGRARIVGDDRTDLDPHLTAVDVALHPGEPRARQAGRDAFEVGEHCPGPIERDTHGELVLDPHQVLIRWW